MAFVLILLGGLIVLAALNNTQSDLATALGQDVPAYLHWALAIIGVGAIGWIPGMRPVSRALLGLVLVVLILMNYRQILTGFQQAATAKPKHGQAEKDPTLSSGSGSSSGSGESSDLMGIGGSFLGGSGGGAGDVGSLFGGSSATGLASDAMLLGVL